MSSADELARQLGELGVEVAQGFGLHCGRRTPLQLRRDEVAGVIDREADQLVELGVGFGRSAGRIALDELPRGVLVGDPGQAGEVEQQAVGQRQRLRRHFPRVDVVDRVAELLLDRLARDNCRGTANIRRPRAE